MENTDIRKLVGKGLQARRRECGYKSAEDFANEMGIKRGRNAG